MPPAQHLALTLLAALAMGGCTTTPAPSARPTPPPAPHAPSPPPDTGASVPHQALPTRLMVTVEALSDADALGPIVDMPVPNGVPQPERPRRKSATPPVAVVPPSVRCQAVRRRDPIADSQLGAHALRAIDKARDAVVETITISCRNHSHRSHIVQLTIDAIGMSGLPDAAAHPHGHRIAPRSERRLATLVATSRPARADIWYTHKAAP